MPACSGIPAHFPDERRLFMACPEMVHDRSPPPDAEARRAVADRGERMTTGLSAIYGWYRRNAAVFGCVLRHA